VGMLVIDILTLNQKKVNPKYIKII
jgi:hypothetical protein